MNTDTGFACCIGLQEIHQKVVKQPCEEVVVGIVSTLNRDHEVYHSHGKLRPPHRLFLPAEFQ